MPFAYQSSNKGQIGRQELVLQNWDSQQGKPFSLPSQRNFPISFKRKVAIAYFFWKMQRKIWYSILGLDIMPLFLKNLLLRFFSKENMALCMTSIQERVVMARIW